MSKRLNRLAQALKWFFICWTGICLLGLGGCTVLSALGTVVKPDDTIKGSASDYIFAAMAFCGAWAIAWAILAAPCAVIWAIVRKD
jgi:hypothetical protein